MNINKILSKKHILFLLLFALNIYLNAQQIDLTPGIANVRTIGGQLGGLVSALFMFFGFGRAGFIFVFGKGNASQATLEAFAGCALGQAIAGVF